MCIRDSSRPDPRLFPFYKQAYDPKQESQFEAIRRAVEERSPEHVAVNISEDCAQADGMTKYLWDQLVPVLDGKMAADDRIAIRWLETRPPQELELYPSAYRIAMAVPPRGRRSFRRRLSPWSAIACHGFHPVRRGMTFSKPRACPSSRPGRNSASLALLRPCLLYTSRCV